MVWTPTRLANSPQIRPIIVGQSGVASSVTGTTAKTALASILIPGGSMGNDGSFDIDISASFTANTNSKTITVEFGGTAIATITRNSATETGFRLAISVANSGSATTQVVSQPNMISTFALFTLAYPVTMNKDTNADLSVVLYGTLGNTADTVSVNRYIARVNPSWS